MTTTAAPNADIVCGTTATTAYMVGTNFQFVILKATATNIDTASHTITVYRVPSGGTAGPTNIMGADAVAIAAGQTVTLPLSGQTIVNGQTLAALADAPSVVNFNVSLAQIS
jgi:hypothetical protein